MTANADYYKAGDWNFYCDLCGAKQKASNGAKTWDGFYVCRYHKEQRNQQDFVRGVADDQSPAWTRPRPVDAFIYTPSRVTAMLNGAPLNTTRIG